jgi:hypothetical protein
VKCKPAFLAGIAILLFAAGAGTGVAVDRIAAGAPAQRASDVRASEAAIERGQLPPAEQVALMRAVAEAYLERRDYAGAISWAQRYLKSGGLETEVRPLLIQAYVQSGDFANAARELQWEVQAAERAQRAPGEDRLLLLQSCYARLNDANAYAWSLEKLVTYYPKREYWADLLDRTERRPDFGEPLSLDVNRLRLRTGVLPGAAAYLKFAAQALQAGFPAEAKAVLEHGYAQGVLGSGPDLRRHRELLKQLTEATRVQQGKLADPQLEAAADKARDGIELVDLGFAHVTQGNFDKGLQLMEQGIRKGGLANKPQIAKLHLGVAYFMAGQKARAIEVFKTVGGKHGGADLGRIWALYARNAS